MSEKDQRAEIEFQRERQQNFSYETTKVGGIIYDVRELEKVAEAIPIQEAPTQNFSDIVKEGRHYWLDKEGQRLGPWDILHNWQAAQNNSAWAEHVATISRANLNRPIWVTKDGDVFNGLHRLTKAFLDNVPKIQVRLFDTLPVTAVVKQ